MPPTVHSPWPPVLAAPTPPTPAPQIRAPRQKLTAYVDTPQILAIEDQPDTQQLLRDGLEASGYCVHIARSGAAAVPILEREPIDLVLLDLMLPDIDGLAVCRAIRVIRSTPIIVLSANAQERRKVELLEAGADDYLTKPTSFAELRARITAALRRDAQPRQAAAVTHERYSYGTLSIDVTYRRVTRAGVAIPLTATEWLLLAALCRSEQRPVASSQLIASVWPDDILRGRGQLHTYVGQLRMKLGTPDLIETVRGFGYRLRAHEATS